MTKAEIMQSLQNLGVEFNSRERKPVLEGMLADALAAKVEEEVRQKPLHEMNHFERRRAKRGW